MQYRVNKRNELPDDFGCWLDLFRAAYSSCGKRLDDWVDGRRVTITYAIGEGELVYSFDYSFVASQCFSELLNLKDFGVEGVFGCLMLIDKIE